MNILHVIDWAGLGGGAEAVALHSANSIPGKNYVYYYRREENFKESEFPNITFIKSKRDYSFFNLLFNAIELKKVIERYAIDIVHSQLFWSNLTARLATPKSKKLFTSIQNIQSKSSLKSKKMQLVERITYRKSETSFCVSEEVKKDYKQIVPFSNAVTLYNFIDDNFFHNNTSEFKRNDNKIKFIAVGTVKPQKNYQFLINVFLALKEKNETDIYLDIFGGGEMMPEFLKLSTELGVNVDFKGEVVHLEKIYPQYNAFIMASLYEGCSVAVLEALASKLPVLLPDLPVLRENTNSNAIFFDGTSVEDCVEKILKFCSNEYNPSQQVENGFLWAKKIASKSTYLNTLLQYYNN